MFRFFDKGGASAIRSVAEQTRDTPYTELKREDQKWLLNSGTNVETQSFYLTADSGHIGLAQIIYSNVDVGIVTKKTTQLNSKIIYPDGHTPPLWTSVRLDDVNLEKGKTTTDIYDTHAPGCDFKLSEDGNSYQISSSVAKDCIVNLKITKVAPGIAVGKDGTTLYGPNFDQPKGSMRHTFWPFCEVEGSMITKDGPVDFKGRGVYSHALQGMIPHYAAARWNFVNFQTPEYSALMMEFTTPEFYDKVIVNVGVIAKKGEILFAGSSNTAEHTEVSKDPENGWPAPTAAKYTWHGKTKEGGDVSVVLAGSLGVRADRVDVMAEVPGFIKTILAAASGTKPYIYQFTPKLTLKGKVAGEEIDQDGRLFTEATFIV